MERRWLQTRADWIYILVPGSTVSIALLFLAFLVVNRLAHLRKKAQLELRESKTEAKAQAPAPIERKLEGGTSLADFSIRSGASKSGAIRPTTGAKSGGIRAKKPRTVNEGEGRIAAVFSTQQARGPQGEIDEEYGGIVIHEDPELSD